MENKLHVAVVAIDFGTSNSGFAFSVKKSDTEILATARNGGKAPSTVLLTKYKDFDCYGAEAEDKYVELAENGEHHDWFYVQNFKMKLYSAQRLTRDITIQDIEGRDLLAMPIFEMIIAEFKSQAANELYDRIPGLQHFNIKWIITVPAIWSDSAKQFMREAAVAAGIENENLELVLEPEAASCYCRDNVLCAVVKLDGSTKTEVMTEGHKYIVADLGGGTADICVHEILDNENLREIYRAEGGAMGGTSVDFAFQSFLEELLGERVWRKFKSESMDEYLELMREFEQKKRKFSQKSVLEDQTIVVNLPAQLLSIFEEENHSTLSNYIVIAAHSKVSTMGTARTKLKIKASVFEGFFKPAVDSIIQCLTNIIEDISKEDSDIGTLLLVGRFSESSYVKETIKLQIKGVKIICPFDGSLAILKGAVYMGFRPKTIVERRARYTYGFGCCIPFQSGVHPKSLKVIRERKEYCGKIFHKLIEKGAVVSSGQIFEMETCNTLKYSESKFVILQRVLYKSTHADPEYCTDEGGCELVGAIDINPPEEGWADIVEVKGTSRIAETEFKLDVIDKSTGKKYNAKLDFLE